jgi:hypothetical protein
MIAAAELHSNAIRTCISKNYINIGGQEQAVSAMFFYGVHRVPSIPSKQPTKNIPSFNVNVTANTNP